MAGLVHIAGLVIWTKKNRMIASAHVDKGYGRRVKDGEVGMKGTSEIKDWVLVLMGFFAFVGVVCTIAAVLVLCGLYG